MAIPETRNLSYQGANLPQVTKEDDGKVLGVKDGKWVVKDDDSGSVLPETAAADVGKSLMVDADGNWGIDSETVTITLSAEEQEALKTTMSAVTRVAATEKGVNYYMANAGGFSETTFRKILDFYASGKDVNLQIDFDGVPFVLTPTAHIATGSGTDASLWMSFSLLGISNDVTIDARILFVGMYSTAVEDPSGAIYEASVHVSGCVPKAVD